MRGVALLFFCLALAASAVGQEDASAEGWDTPMEAVREASAIDQLLPKTAREETPVGKHQTESQHLAEVNDVAESSEVSSDGVVQAAADSKKQAQADLAAAEKAVADAT